jgi:pimeloyl-ACP methyl ester carboxylesterase
MRQATPAPLVLLPGLLCDSRVFAGQLARFPDAIAIDGFGRRNSLESMARHVLKTVPGAMSLLGHSMGGRVALEVFRLAPERVERLALLSTGIHLPQPGEAAKRQVLLDLADAEGAAALVDRWLPPMVAPARLGDDRLMAPLRTMCIEAGVGAFAAQIAALLGRPALESLMPLINCPTLVAVGSEDAWSPPAQHRAIAASIADAHLIIVEGSGHMLPAEAPDALNAAIADWLSLPILRRP